MKNLVVGMVAGAVLGMALCSTDCGQKAIRKAKRRFEKVCDCAEHEMRELKQDISEVISPEEQM